MKFLTKIGLMALSLSFLAFGVEVKNIDNGLIDIKIQNKRMNVLTFPFIIKRAKVRVSEQDIFKIDIKGGTVTIVPNANSNAISSELVVWSADNYPYLINITLSDNGEQYWKFTSKRVNLTTPETARYETGKVDQDVKRLIKAVINNHNIPGYRKVKVGRQFTTQNTTMEKAYIYNGSKYRVEEWYIKNNAGYPLQLEESEFYTKGILAISFEKKVIPANAIVKAYLIIDKASLEGGE